MSEEMLRKIQGFLEGVSLRSLFSSAKKISNDYRLLGKRAEQREEDILAYLATRMPATYASLTRVFHELKQRIADFQPRSLMDVGSGPGTSLWAALSFFTELQEVYCVERDAHFLTIAKRLTEELWFYPYVKWLQADMRKDVPETACDLVLASYCIGELTENESALVVQKLWTLTKKILIILEPGTPKGFTRVRALRKQLLEAGAYLVGPCPHAQECPMSQGDWCHFYARLNRSSLHRKAKGAELNYEDEKFSYLIFSKDPIPSCSQRILRHPRKGKGHVQWTLCTKEGIKESVVTKKDRELYALAKKSRWGDGIK